MRLLGVLISIVATFALAARATAASTFYIRGGGDGHGIGMSQYGAYGYALHGKDYRFILGHYYQGTLLRSTDSHQTVRVLLSTGSAAFSGATRAGKKHLNPNLTYYVQPLANGRVALVTHSDRNVGRFSAPLKVTGPGLLNVPGLGAYRGALEFRPTRSGGVETVNALALEDYVRGVISAEMPASWSLEALKAQAVAARTYAITTSVGGPGYNLYPDTRSQMYRGVSAETSSTDAAVAATTGQVVTYNGVPVVTYFFNSSAGHTENVENVWPGSSPEPWLRGVSDPYDNAGGDPYHRWSYDLSIASAAAHLRRLVKGRLVGVHVTKHGSSSRVLSADVVGTGGQTHVSGADLQHAFGLHTTYAAFTTISTVPGLPVTGAPGGKGVWHRGVALPQRVLRAQAMLALMPLVQSLVAGATHGVHGTVFLARAGSSLQVQEQGRRGWQTVGDTRVSWGGSYGAAVPGSGTYRIVYKGMDGPPVTVS